MTWVDYFTIPAISFSRLKRLDDSPKHFQYFERHPQPDTPQLALGRYVHTAVLQPDQLETEYAIYDGRRQGGAWEAFKTANADKTIFRREDVADMTGIVNALRYHETVQALLSAPDAQIEQVLTWYDPASGADCKARLDYASRSLSTIMDIKTTRSIDIRRFGHEVHRYRYHGQGAMYKAGIEAAQGWTPEHVVLIAVEKDPPHDVGVFPMAEATLEVGRVLVESLLARLKECTEKDEWPGRHPKPVTLGADNLPPWMFGGGIPDISWSEDP